MHIHIYIYIYIPGNAPRGGRNQIINGFTVGMLMVLVAGCVACACVCACAEACVCAPTHVQSCLSHSPSLSSPLCGPHWCLIFFDRSNPMRTQKIMWQVSDTRQSPHQFLIWSGATSSNHTHLAWSHLMGPARDLAWSHLIVTMPGIQAVGARVSHLA